MNGLILLYNITICNLQIPVLKKSESETALSFAKQEIDVGNINLLVHSTKERSSFIEDESDDLDYSYLNINNIPPIMFFFKLKQLGRRAQTTRNKQLASIVKRLQTLHELLVACPSKDEKAKNPRGLKAPLMLHQ